MTSLPQVSISFSNGNLPVATVGNENKVGLVVHAATPGGWAFGTNQLITGLDDLPANLDPEIQNLIKAFYQEMAFAKQELWVRTVANTTLHDDMVTVHAAALLQASGYSIRTIAVLTAPDAAYAPTIVDGMDGKVYDAAVAAQILGETLTVSKHAPLLTLLNAFNFNSNANDIRDFSQVATTFNRVGIVVDDDLNLTMCALARIATTTVQRNIGRVASGPIVAGGSIVGVPVEEYEGLDELHKRRYITARKHDQKAGYYFSDDNLCTANTDDYRSIANRRTIDKAYGIAYLNMVERLLEDVPINSDGTIQASLVKSWQQSVVNDIATKMAGEISGAPDVPGDVGVSFFIATNQNVVANPNIACRLRVRPVIHARYIDIDLGFALNLTQTP